MQTATKHPELAFTRRQKECLLLLKDGMTSKQIARRLDISPRTVDQHIAAIIETLGVTSRLAAVSRLHEIDLAELSTDRIEEPFMFRSASADKQPLIVDKSPDRPRQSILPRLGGQRNSASRSERIIWMMRIAMLGIMLTCVAVLSIMAVSLLAEGMPW